VRLALIPNGGTDPSWPADLARRGGGVRYGIELRLRLVLRLGIRNAPRSCPALLFHLACDYLRSGRVIRPGPEWLSRRVAAAREVAKAETYQRIEPALIARKTLRSELDGLLVVDPDLGSTPLALADDRGPTRASPAAVKAELAKYSFLRGLDAHDLALSGLPAERLRFLATIGRRSTAQALSRREPERRYRRRLAWPQPVLQAIRPRSPRRRSRLGSRIASLSVPPVG